MSGNKYRIFINGKPLFILPMNNESYNSIQGESLIWKGKQTMLDALENISKEIVTRVNVYSRDTEVAFLQLASQFKVRHAAGGLVKNHLSQYLFIYRRKNWDLPKGKMDDGESPAETAIREVKEECGLNNLNIISRLPDTFHYYPEKEKKILKRTHWFLMTTDETKVTVETEEDIESFIWLEKEKILKHISPNVFPNILELVKNCFEQL
ncbi:MAG: NUDIX domain-containing protein [Bacteroidia bacterium]|nr:NUDIX domain-containing protein [Bacteroidia bacterium]